MASLGEKEIRPGETVNFAADWTDWLDTDRDATADDTIASSTWSVISGGGGLTVGATTQDANNLISTAAFTCAATVPVGHVFGIRNEMTTTTSTETFRREGILRVVAG